MHGFGLHLGGICFSLLSVYLSHMFQKFPILICCIVFGKAYKFLLTEFRAQLRRADRLSRRVTQLRARRRARLGSSYSGKCTRVVTVYLDFRRRIDHAYTHACNYTLRSRRTPDHISKSEISSHTVAKFQRRWPRESRDQLNSPDSRRRDNQCSWCSCHRRQPRNNYARDAAVANFGAPR